MIADSGRIGSLEDVVMELNPGLDVQSKTAPLTVELIESLFGKSTLMRPVGARRPIQTAAGLKPRTRRAAISPAYPSQ